MRAPKPQPERRDARARDGPQHGGVQRALRPEATRDDTQRSLERIGSVRRRRTVGAHPQGSVVSGRARRPPARSSDVAASVQPQALTTLVKMLRVHGRDKRDATHPSPATGSVAGPVRAGGRYASLARMDSLGIAPIACRRVAWGCALSAALLACGGEDREVLPEGCDRFVAPTGDVQTALQRTLIEARAGQVVCLDGVYRLTDEVLVEADGLVIRGSGAARAVLDFSGQSFGANGLHVQSVEGIRIERIEVRETRGDGIRIDASRNVVLRDVVVGWSTPSGEQNGAYGLYPVGCTNVLIEDSEVYGARDAGFYVGQSRNVVVRRNRAHGNVAGIEIENTVGAEVYENEATDNTGGILVFDLPGLSMQGGDVLVRDNRVVANNRANFAAVGTIVSYLPAGTGVMLLAMDRVEVRDNTIEGNESTGLLSISYKIVEAVGAGGSVPRDYDPYGETVHVHDNVFRNNGTMPRDLLVGAGPTPLEDIVWDGVTDPMKTDPEGRLRLCIRNNGSARFRNLQLDPSSFRFGEGSTDLAPHDCMHPPVPGVELSL
ncbi:MAG: parallel beta-helix domain-containing protein [Myxococcales bacterium]|nr:parallel beta-helix domain-containing protein [Myxococcales bacterium]